MAGRSARSLHTTTTRRSRASARFAAVNPGDAATPRHRRQLIPLPLPVAVLCAGMLVNAASTVWDLLHFREFFAYGTSQNGATAYLMEVSFAWVRLIGAVLLVPVLWVAARRARQPASRSPAVVGPLCVVLAACGGLLSQPNDGRDPQRLGIVHDAGAPAWIGVADIAGPGAMIAGALGALLLILRATVTWWRT